MAMFGGSGYDFKVHRDGRNWRMLAFPKGFAEYKDVPSRAAQQFDRFWIPFAVKSFSGNKHRHRSAPEQGCDTNLFSMPGFAE
jgi:hypothetical protein